MRPLTKVLPFFLLAAVAVTVPVLSAAAGREPVEISADRLEASDVTRTLVFIGNAVARQGDVTIEGDRLTIHYAADGGDVERIAAEGHVRIVQGERLATGEKADYFRGEERLVLSGSPKVSEGGSSVQGHEIILFLKEDRSEVRGGADGRVNAVFQPKAETAP